MNNPIELKPCPFCGGKARLTTCITRCGSRDLCAAYCKCEKCEVKTKTIVDVDGNGKFVFRAIDAWNGRESEKRKMVEGEEEESA